VGEAHDHLVDHLVGAHGAAHRNDLGVSRPVSDEAPVVEVGDRLSADAAHHRRHVVDEGLGGHRRHCRLDVLGDEFSSHMLIEKSC
jgi:hypothetical protein